MKSAIAVLAVVVAVISSPPEEGGEQRWGVQPQGGNYDVSTWLRDLKERQTTPRTTKRPSPRPTPQPRLVKLVPACASNNPWHGGNADAMCPAAQRSCPQGGYLVWVFTTTTITNPSSDAWEMINTRCVTAREPGRRAEREAPALDEAAFRRLKLPAAGLHLQPMGRPVLINVETNSYASADAVTLTTTLLGTAIEVQATPARFTWDYGDGTVRTTSDPGHPYPNMTVAHVYTRPGRYQVTLTTTYTGRYRVQGSPDWLPVDGTAEVASQPVMLEAIETRAVLVP